jgi:cyclic pyranopterin phosphate synthase
MPKQKKLTHVDAAGQAKMVDVGAKQITRRRAVAAGFISLSPETRTLLKQNKLQKGNAIEVARLAGIMAAKRTHELIPLCHPLLLSQIDVQINLQKDGADIYSTVICEGKTGVEMEALTACSIAALTIYDMCKAVDKSMTISHIRLLEKEGGRSGRWVWGE